MAIERPQYSAVTSEPPYELRIYPPSIVAEVHVKGARSEAVGAGFRILADYIFGGNVAKASSSMTSPVTQVRGESIAMTAPVEQQSVAGGWDVRFIMPAGYTLSNLPKPTDSRVHMVEIPRHRVAAIKFSGFWSDANLESHAALLEGWLKTKKLTATSPPCYAYYDPPWTPWFMRTIEVLVDVAGP
jgi:hypothetical protein